MIGQVALTEQTTFHPDKTRYFLGVAEIDGNSSKWQFFARESLKRVYKTGGGVHGTRTHVIPTKRGEAGKGICLCHAVILCAFNLLYVYCNVYDLEAYLLKRRHCECHDH